MDWQSRITIDPNILVGKPIIKSTRLAVEFIIDLVAQGWTTDEILHNYPGITLEDLQACLSYASAYETFLKTPGIDLKSYFLERTSDRTISRLD